MTYTAIVLAAALKVKVSGALLLAVCSHESNLTNVVVHGDGGSSSYGICQVKEGTARMFGFTGKAKDLMDPFVNAKYAARYLKYQEKRYGGDSMGPCKMVAAYNAGRFNESKRVPGKPMNLRYVRNVQNRLAEHLQPMLSCEMVGTE